MQRFEGTGSYVATEDLKVAVNAAMLLRRPLLVKGEPGTGKTVLAQEVATAMGAPLIDEIDKADIEFPNDLLQELDRMQFDVYETGERVAAQERPIVVITSN